MKKGQSTLEYVFLIAVVVSAFLAVLMYVSRGMQGSLRSSADQLGANQYAPGQATIRNEEIKTTNSTTYTDTTTTITHDVLPDDANVAATWAAKEKDLTDLADLNKKWKEAMTGTTVPANSEGYGYATEYIATQTPLPAATVTSDLEVQIKAMQEKYYQDLEAYRNALKNTPKPAADVITTSDKSEKEKGKTTDAKDINESLSNY